jgi:hypothetical protein
MDKWSWCNELVQNLVCSGVTTLWLYLIYIGRAIPTQLDLAFGAVLFYLGFKTYKTK